MKRRHCLFPLVFLSVGILFYFSSCQKSNNTLPSITLYSGSLYVSADTTLQDSTIFNVYVAASKAGPDQLLTKATISKSIDGGPDTVLQTMNLSSQYLSQFYSFRTGDSGTVERYTFWVQQTNELSADTSIFVTVQ